MDSTALFIELSKLSDDQLLEVQKIAESLRRMRRTAPGEPHLPATSGSAFEPTPVGSALGGRARRGLVPRIVADVVKANPGASGAHITKLAMATDPSVKRSSIHPTLARLIEAGDVRRTGEGHNARFYPVRKG